MMIELFSTLNLLLSLNKFTRLITGILFPARNAVENIIIQYLQLPVSNI